MKLISVGHDYKYALEQIMLALYPHERPCYAKAQSGDEHILPLGEPLEKNNETELTAKSALSFSGHYYAQATTEIFCGDRDKIYRGTARVKKEKLNEKLIADRLLQKIIKQSFYRAAVKHIPSRPVWGSLTGIRPAKIAQAAFDNGLSEKAAKKILINEYYVSPGRAEIAIDAARFAAAQKTKLKPRDIALYIGIPFCPTRCAYCSFVSNSVEKSFDLVAPFVDTLVYEISEISKMAQKLGLNITSAYIGGGTPTALSAEMLHKVMHALGSYFAFVNLREYTVEAGRPDTITPEKIEVIKKHGAGRICVNPQSMSARVLEAIGRRHTPEDFYNAFSLANEAELDVNIDLIAGLPKDTVEGFSQTLKAIAGLSPQNITIHTLSKKKGSRITLEDTEIPTGGDVAEMLGITWERLKQSGYRPYYLYRQKFTSGGFENAGWAKPSYECEYNICMMEELCTVISLGGGGVTKLVSPNGIIQRIFNAKFPREYIMQKEGISAKIEKIGEFLSRESGHDL